MLSLTGVLFLFLTVKSIITPAYAELISAGWHHLGVVPLILRHLLLLFR